MPFAGTIAALASVVFIVGCSTVAPATPLAQTEAPPRLPAGAIEIPTATTAPNVDGCAGVGLPKPVVLGGSPTERPAAWSEYGGERGAIVWPIGYYAIFDPALEVIGQSGHVVARQGDDLSSLQIGGAVVCVGPRGGVVFAVP